MADKILTFTRLIYGTLEKKVVFYFAVILLGLQSFWLSLSAVYPLPFDEYMHVGITRLYASHWSPFLTSQPASASLYGDITRDPSYLYHYLMSFPYRLLDVFISNQTFLIISMRLLNVTFVCIGLFFFRKLLLKWGISKRITHVALLIFVCTPIVPLLAAHNNYDNLLFLLIPLFLLIVTKLILKEGNLIVNLSLYFSLGFIASLVKYTFIPMFAIVSLYLFALYIKRRDGISLKAEWRKLNSKLILFGLLLMLVISFGLFIERPVANIISYHSISPKCEDVQSIEVCKDFMPWARNQENLKNKSAEKLYGNPISFTQHWVTKSMRGFFAIFSHTPTQVVSNKEPFGPIVLKPLLPLPIAIAYLVLLLGISAVVLQFKKIWTDQFLRFSLVLSSGYLSVLWLFNYQGYLKLGVAQAIQARYTLPILIIVYVLIAWSVNQTFKSENIKTALLILVFVAYCWGGGIAGYLIWADQNWYWQNTTVININKRIQNILRYVVIY